MPETPVRGRRKTQWGRVLVTFAWLGLVWWLWSGHTEPMIIGFGVASCALVVWLSLRMEIVDDEGEPTSVVLGLIGYVPWLLLEIAKANVHVARVIWSPQMPLRRRLFSVPTSQASELGNAIYANSITLTPGTIALDVRRDTILVHALTKDSQEGLETGDMDRRVTRLEGGGGTP